MGRTMIGARGKCCECPEPAWRAAAFLYSGFGATTRTRRGALLGANAFKREWKWCVLPHGHMLDVSVVFLEGRDSA